MHTRLLISDDQILFREGIKSVFSNGKKSSIRCVGEASNYEELLAKTEEMRPDIILCGVSFPVRNGFETIRHISRRYPQIKLLAISIDADVETIQAVIEAGVSGFILKNIDIASLVEAIDKTMQGQSFFSTELGEKLLYANGNKARNAAQAIFLSDREREILSLVCREFSNKMIAAKLDLSIRSVETYRHRVMQKANACNYAGLVLFAVKNHFVDL